MLSPEPILDVVRGLSTVRRARAAPLRRPGPRRLTLLAAEQAARPVRVPPPRPPSRARAQVASFAIVYTQFDRLLNDIFTSECEVCRGTGRIICKHCRGTKTLRTRPGVFTIQRLQVVDRDPADVCAAPPLPASRPPLALLDPAV